jgi:hypothetical protein
MITTFPSLFAFVIVVVVAMMGEGNWEAEGESMAVLNAEEGSIGGTDGGGGGAMVCTPVMGGEMSSLQL